MSTNQTTGVTRTQLAQRFCLGPDQLGEAAITALLAVAERGMLADGASLTDALLASFTHQTEVNARLDGLATIVERLCVDAMALHAVVAQHTVVSSSAANESSPK